MPQFNVQYFETRSGNYLVEAECKMDAEDKVRDMIKEGLLEKPNEYEDSWTDISVVKKLYKVKVIEKYERDVEVYAEDEDQAYEEVDAMIVDGAINLPCDGKEYGYNRELFVRKGRLEE